MNIKLTEQIVRHILANFLIIPSNHVDANRSQALVSKEFLLKEKIKIELDDKSIIKNNIYGCQLSTGDQEIKILVSDCTQDTNVPEFCLIMQLKNAPIYGIYLIYNDLDENINSDPLIACSLDGAAWMLCTTYLQATFLAGMEQLKDAGFGWSQCADYEDQFKGMMSFLEYYNEFYEAEYAGQEN